MKVNGGGSLGNKFNKAGIIQKLTILGIGINDMGWAIITRKDGLYGFIDTTTGTIVEPKYGGYSINDWFFYGILPNYNNDKMYNKGQFYVRGIKDRLFKRTEYLDVEFGAGDFRVASVGNTKLRGKDYLVNYKGQKLFLSENELRYGAKRIGMTNDGLYLVDYDVYDCDLNKID